MKHFLILGLLISSTSVFASTFANIKSLSNPNLESSRRILNDLDLVSHSGTKRVVVLKASGSTQQQVRENTVAQALHTVCRFFDDGVELGLVKKTSVDTKKAAAEFADGSLDVEDSALKALESALQKANREESVEVYSGGASGNNTMGTVLGFYDVKNNEVAVFANTNCGSDD